VCGAWSEYMAGGITKAVAIFTNLYNESRRNSFNRDPCRNGQVRPTDFPTFARLLPSVGGSRVKTKKGTGNRRVRITATDDTYASSSAISDVIYTRLYVIVYGPDGGELLGCVGGTGLKFTRHVAVFDRNALPATQIRPRPLANAIRRTDDRHSAPNVHEPRNVLRRSAAKVPRRRCIIIRVSGAL